MPTQIESLQFDSREQWRSWLEINHASTNEVWLIIWKKKYQDQGLDLEQAVREALCFGWIDGKLLSLDEKRFRLRFSPGCSSFCLGAFFC